MLRIATRGSQLALAQAESVKQIFEDKGYIASLVIIETKGDQQMARFSEIQGDGFFTKEVEKALLEDKADFAVHSMKDLPSMKHADLPWVAISPRASSKDLLIYKNPAILTDRQKKWIIGSSSPRRQKQLIFEYPNVELKDIRGNINTRINKLVEGNYDAIVLAEAGLQRLKLFDELKKQGLSYSYLNTVTAACQGFLALQSSQRHIDILESLKDPALHEVALAEKEILQFFGGGCHLAVGANVQLHDAWDINVYAYWNHKGYQINASDYGLHLSMQKFTRDLLQQLYPESKAGGRVLLTQRLRKQLKVAEMLQKKNKRSVFVPQIDVQSKLQIQDLEHLKWSDFDSIAFSSQVAVEIFLLEFSSLDIQAEHLNHIHFYTVGPETAHWIKEWGVDEVLLPKQHTAKDLGEMLKNHTKHCLVLGNSISKLKKFCEENQISHQFLEVYETIKYEGVFQDRPHEGDQVVFASPSAVKNFFDSFGKDWGAKLKCYAMGPTTGRALDELKIPYQKSKSSSWEDLLELL